ncbi:MAG: fused MFS/spermidine synthase, partial [Phycisphaerae bacterium]|nr:fused MFS/spermidine synthase [Phycisphaerae bacterium]
MTSTPTWSSLRSRAYALFFLSGAAGLIYELLWISRFGRVFGNSTYAIGTVLAAYMGGLALGSYLLGGRADRARNGLRVYAILETLVALTALLVNPLLSLARLAYIPVAQQENAVLTMSVRLLISLLVLLPPTLCMGGTLPVLVRFCTAREDNAGRRLGHLYALNTFGAVVGCLGAGLLLLPALGERLTLLTAVVINFTVAVLAWMWSGAATSTSPQQISPATVVDRDLRARSDAARRSASTSSDQRRPLNLLAVLAIAGFASMGFEIAWTRVVALVLGSSVYAFTAMLGVFLVGLAIGGALAGAILKRVASASAHRISEPTPAFGHPSKEGIPASFPSPGGVPAGRDGSAGSSISCHSSPIWCFVAAELGIMAWLLATLPHYDRIATFIGIFNQAAGGHFDWILSAIFMVCVFIMLVPAVLMGTTIPFIMTAVNKGETVGRHTGLVYASNTAGGIAGSLVAGFVLVPLIGIQ